MNELMLAWALAGNTMPMHYRRDGYTPEEVYQSCSTTLGPEDTLTITNNAYDMSRVLIGTLVQDGVMANTTDIWNVTWTSNEDSEGSVGDHERLTGIKDTNSDADVMFQTVSNQEFIGISAKYGTSKNITLRNPGKALLEVMLSIGDLDHYKRGHDELIAWTFQDRVTGELPSVKELHEKYKAERDQPWAKQMERSSLEYRKRIAGAIRDRLVGWSSDEVKGFVLQLCANETVFRHYRTHTRPRRDGGVDHHVSQVDAHSRERAEAYDGYHVRSGDSTTVSIYARNVEHDVVEVVATLGIKSRSGPMTGWNGTFTAPMLTDRRRKKKVVVCFDLDDTLFWYPDEEAPTVTVRDPDGNVVDNLPPSVYNGHRLQPGHFYTYEGWTSADDFRRMARPVQKVIDKLKSFLAKGHHVCIVTARHDFDDKELFLTTLADHGIDVSRVHVHRSGRIKGRHESTAAAKRRYIEEHLVEVVTADEVHLYDDNADNLREFSSIPGVVTVPVQVRFNRKTGKASWRRFKG
jgi:hypothetical protein